MIDAVFRDLVLALRRLAAQPGTSLVIVLTLAFGIGVTTSIFSLVNGILLRDLPFARATDIVEIRQQAPAVGVHNVGLSVAEIDDYRRHSEAIEAFVEFHFMYFFIDGDAPALVKAGVVSANFFDFLGVAPVLGRGLVAADDAADAEPVIVLSHGFWRSRYGGDADVVGRIIEMNGQLHRVVGVLPDLPQFPTVTDVYLPTTGCPTRRSAGFVHDRGARMLSLYGRTRLGVDLPQAQADIDRITARMHAEHPARYPPELGLGTRVLGLQDELGRGIRPALQLLLAASLLVFLVTCSNVVNLGLARHSRQQRELAVRSALGASRFALARRQLAESLLLALAGGIGGLLIAHASLDLLVSFAAGFTSRAGEIRLDGQALALTALLSLVVGVLVGLAPLFGRSALVGALKDEATQSTTGAGRRRMRQTLVVAQVAMAFMLVTGAGLMLRGLLALHAVDPGFRSDGITAVTIPLNWSRYPDDDAVRRFAGELEQALAGMPGISRWAIADGYPFGHGVGISHGQAQLIFDDGRDDGDGAHFARYRAVDAGYFDVLGIPRRAGRTFERSDDRHAPPVAVIGASMAARHWPGEDPLGRRFRVGETAFEVIGVVGDVRSAGLDQPAADEFYLSFSQQPSQHINLLLHGAAEPAAIAAQVREAVRRIDPAQPVTRITTLSRALADSLGSPRLLAQVLGVFSLLALAIALVGVSGLLAYTVSLRTRELGIRLALGAEPQRIRALVLRQGLLLVGLGLLLGALGSLVLARLAGGLLQGVAASDGTSHVVIAALFLLVALAACWLPAARAGRLAPTVAIRAP